MTDDLCGAETADGGECQNPASEGDSCWIDAHGGSASVGRPTSFTDELAREAVDAVSDAYSTAAVEEQIGVGRGTIDNGDASDGDWLSQDLTYVDKDGNERDFSEAFRRARGDTHAELIRAGIYSDDADSSFIKFILSTSYGHKKTEKREHEHAGEGGGPLEVVIGGDRDE